MRQLFKGILFCGELEMAPKFEDYEEIKKPANKQKRGFYHNYTKDDLKRAGLVPIDERGRLLRCVGGERVLCFYDNYPLAVDVRGQVAVLKKCNQCGTIYYSTPEKPKEKPVLTDAIGFQVEPQKPSELEIKASEETLKQEPEKEEGNK